jgi:hypothetical protein
MTTKPPDETPAEELKALVRRFGTGLGSEPSRVGGLLRDVCGQYRMEISLIVAAAAEGIPAALLSGSRPTSGSQVGALARRLEANRGLSETNARWAVQAWSAALVPAGEEAVPPASDGGSGLSGGDYPIVAPPPIGEQHVMTAPVAHVEPPPVRRRRWALLVAAMVAAVVLVAGVAVAMLRSSPDPEQPLATGDTSDVIGTPTGPTGDTSSQVPVIVVNPPRALHGTGTTTSLSSSSVTLRWKRPPFGERPERFIVLRDGEEIKRTTKLKFTDTDLTWGTSHVYRVQSVAMGETSKNTKAMRVTVPNPPLSDARLEGSAGTSMNLTYHAPFASASSWSHSASWTFSPTCGSGPCSVRWSASHNGSIFSGSTGGTLSRSSSTYSGSDSAPVANTCDNRNVPTTVSIIIRATSAAEIGSEWRVTAFSGTMTEYTNWPAACGGITQRTASWSFSGSLP